MTKKLKILLADDHSIVRSGLKSLLEADEDFSVVAEAGSGEEAIAQVAKRKPDLAILDITMPGMNGIEATRIIKRNHPTVRILILTIHENEEYVAQMVQAGASGYLLKEAGKKELFQAIRTIASGGKYFSSGISNMMIENFIRRAQHPSAPSTPLPGPQRLTGREKEVLKHIAEGMTNRAIAEKLFLSVRTINTHRVNLMRKLEIHDTASLVRYAIQEGIVGLKK